MGGALRCAVGPRSECRLPRSWNHYFKKVSVMVDQNKSDEVAESTYRPLQRSVRPPNGMIVFHSSVSWCVGQQQNPHACQQETIQSRPCHPCVTTACTTLERQSVDPLALNVGYEMAIVVITHQSETTDIKLNPTINAVHVGLYRVGCTVHNGIHRNWTRHSKQQKKRKGKRKKGRPQPEWKKGRYKTRAKKKDRNKIPDLTEKDRNIITDLTNSETKKISTE